MVDSKKLDSDQLGPLAQQLQEFLKNGIVGQERAIKDLVSAADFYEAGFRDVDRPIYSALFLGPSGVGKTLSAEILAEFFFGGRQAFTKIACADYQEEHAIAKLIGSPPGYVGFWNPDDPKYKGAEPIFSQFNIDKHDFLYQQKHSDTAKKLKELETRYGALGAVYEDLSNKYWIKLNEMDRKNTQEFGEIEGRLNAAEQNYDNVRGQNPDDPELPKLRQGIDALKRQLKCEKASRERMRVDEVEKSEEQLRMTSVAMKKIKEEYEDLLKKHKDIVNYSPKSNHRSIILFDEFEKANQSLLRLLLEILDKGRLTLSNGSVTRFTNSFIILTSNIGSKKISEILSSGGLGFKPDNKVNEEDKDEAIFKETLTEATKVLPPEFRGRLNNIIVFRPLTRENLREILEIQIRDLYNLLVKNEFPLILKIAPDVKEFLINKATDRAEYGARLLKNKVKKYLVEPLSRLKNRQEIKAGDIVHVYLLRERREKRVCFRQEPPPLKDSENKVE